MICEMIVAPHAKNFQFLSLSLSLSCSESWQNHWEEHVASWNAELEEHPLKKTWPIRALDLNQEHKSRPFRTNDEEAYPDNVMLKAFLMVKIPQDGVDVDEATGNKIRIWSEADSGKSNLASENLFDCEIVKRYDVGQSAHMPVNNTMYDVTWSNGKSTTLVKNVPHKALVFLDKSETGDQHEPAAFRHWIGIPDDVFPQGPWRNLRRVDEEEDEPKTASET